MKTILTISLILIGMMGRGQEAKLSSVYIVDAENGDTTYEYQYTYDDEENLLYRDFINSIGTHFQRKYYQNDTIIKSGLIKLGDQVTTLKLNNFILIKETWLNKF